MAPLVAELRAALDGLLDYEIVYVDDGSEDGTAAEVARLQAETPHLRLLRHMRSCGQSAAIRSGVRAARAAWIATLDGDGQNDPADIPKLWRIGLSAPEAPSLLIAGYREKPAGQLDEALRIPNRQPGTAPDARRRHAGYWMRFEAVSALAFPGPAVFRPYAPISSGSRIARGRDRAVDPGQPSSAARGCLEIRRLRPAGGRRRRSFWCDLAEAPSRSAATPRRDVARFENASTSASISVVR